MSTVMMNALKEFILQLNIFLREFSRVIIKLEGQRSTLPILCFTLTISQ